jgi:hypothetical protein
MSEKLERREGERPTKRGTIPVEGAALALGLFSLATDQQEADRAAKLALRGPEPLKQAVLALLEKDGRDTAQLMTGEPDTPPTLAEIKEFLEPNLRKGATLAGLTQLMSTYLLDESSTPEEVIILIYIIARLVVSQTREPSGDEGRRIWSETLKYARHARLVAPRWEEYEKEGHRRLEDWLDVVKEKASGKFKTFIRRTKQIEANADRAFKNLMSLFDDGADRA